MMARTKRKMEVVSVDQPHEHVGMIHGGEKAKEVVGGIPDVAPRTETCLTWHPNGEGLEDEEVSDEAEEAQRAEWAEVAEDLNQGNEGIANAWVEINQRPSATPTRDKDGKRRWAVDIDATGLPCETRC